MLKLLMLKLNILSSHQISKIDRNDHLKSFNLEFDDKPTKTVARILPRPCLDGNISTYDQLYHWGVLNLSKKINPNELEKFINELIRLDSK